MDGDDRELVRRLMARITAELEDAVELAVAGQADRLRADDHLRLALRLVTAADGIAVLAGAAATVAGRSSTPPEDGPPGR